jgi:hypothetical protein
VPDYIANHTRIRGIFRSLATFHSTVVYTVDNERHVCSVRMPNDATRDGAGSDVFFLTSIAEPQKGALSFDLDNVLYEAAVGPHQQYQAAFALPQRLAPVRERSSIRVSAPMLGPEPVVAELRGYGWRSYGTIQNINATHALIRLRTAPTVIHGTSIDLWLYHKSRQIYDGTAVIARSTCVAHEFTDVLVMFPMDSGKHRGIRGPRHKLEVSTNVQAFWPDHNGFRLYLRLEDVAHTGFYATVLTSTFVPPVGAILYIADYDCFGRIVRRTTDGLAIDLRVNDRRKLDAWMLAVEQWANNNITKLGMIEGQRRLLSVVMRSGYLQGAKADAFREEPALLLMPPNCGHTRSWLQRFSRPADTSVDTHIAFLRLSDSSWMIQEISNASDVSGIGDQLICDSIRSFCALNQVNTASEVMISLFDHKSKFNRAFWIPRTDVLRSLLRAAYVIDDVHAAAPSGAAGIFNCTRLDLSDWDIRYDQLIGHFSRQMLAILGLTELSCFANDLTERLSASGYICQRKVWWLADQKGQVAVAVHFGHPTFANLTATANHLWVLAKSKEQLADIHSWLAHGTNELLRGVTQIVGIVDAVNELNEETHMPEKWRKYGVYAVPIQCLQEFLEKTYAK